MNEEDRAVKFLRCSASALVDLALEMANLTDKERIAVELCGRRGLTRDEAVEELQKTSTPREIDAILEYEKNAQK